MTRRIRFKATVVYDGEREFPGDTDKEAIASLNSWLGLMLGPRRMIPERVRLVSHVRAEDEGVDKERTYRKTVKREKRKEK